MCMILNEKITEKKAIEFMENGTSTILAWKIVSGYRIGWATIELRSPFQRTKIDIGEQNAIGELDTIEINGGAFHSYLRKDKARLDMCSYNETLLRITIPVDSIVGFGGYKDDDPSDNHICSTKIRVSKRDYERACTKLEKFYKYMGW